MVYEPLKGRKIKIVKLNLVAAMAASLCSVASANNLSQALKEGTVKGEFTTTYEKRSVDNELSKWNNYYNNTAYSVGSFALEYQSGTWNNFSLTAKFRAYQTLFEGGENETQYKGTGIGLFMSAEIIRSHMKGTLSVSNENYTYDGVEYSGAKFTIEINT